MAVIVEFNWLDKTVRATINHSEWTCDDPDILSSIEAAADLYTGGPEVPYLDRHEAEFVINLLSHFHGHIIHADPRPKGREGVYSSHQAMLKSQEQELKE